MSSVATVTLLEGKERSLLRRHPWIFSGAIASVDGKPAPGDTVDVRAAGGALLGCGAYSPESQLRVRMWTFDASERPSPAWFRTRIERAVRARDRLLEATPTDACRLVNSESDGLPGLVVDRYGSFLVCQLSSAGAERWRAEIVDALAASGDWQGIYERSDAEIRRKEGLPLRSGVLAGREPDATIEIVERGLRFLVDVRRGHKTGFYLDQRDARAALAEHAPGATLLNAFAYTGAFAVVALAAGATMVTNVEASADAIALAAHNVERNGLDAARVESTQGDVFTVLRGYRDRARRFDVIVLDPPKFAESRAQVERACRGYKDINLLAIKLVASGGTLLTFSCSGAVSADLFQKVVAGAASDAGRDVQIVGHLGQASDHPTLLSFPEGAYLKGLVCRVW